jgi:hypothetical protein
VIVGEYVLFLLAAVGLTAVIVESKLFKPLRDFAERWPWLHSLLTCYQCSGFWAGIIVYPFVFGYDWAWPAGGLASSFLAVVAAATLNWLEANTVISLPSDPPKEK